VRDNPPDCEIAGIRDAFAPEIKSKANREEWVEYDQKQSYQDDKWIRKQGNHDECKAQVLKKDHNSIEGFRVALQRKEYPEKLRAGEEESGDHDKLEDTGEPDQFIRQKKVYETTPDSRVQAEEDTVHDEPQRCPFIQKGAHGNEIHQDQRKQSKKDSV
jgi:hypothetical protein